MYTHCNRRWIHIDYYAISIYFLSEFFKFYDKSSNQIFWRETIHYITLGERKWCWWVYYYGYHQNERGEFDSVSYCPTFSLQTDTFLQSSNQKLLLLRLSNNKRHFNTGTYATIINHSLPSTQKEYIKIYITFCVYVIPSKYPYCDNH